MYRLKSHIHVLPIYAALPTVIQFLMLKRTGYIFLVYRLILHHDLNILMLHFSEKLLFSSFEHLKLNSVYPLPEMLISPPPSDAEIRLDASYHENCAFHPHLAVNCCLSQHQS